MLNLTNIHKTFNPGTINEKVALAGVDLTSPEPVRNALRAFESAIEELRSLLEG